MMGKAERERAKAEGEGRCRARLERRVRAERRRRLRAEGANDVVKSGECCCIAIQIMRDHATYPLILYSVAVHLYYSVII